MGQDPGESELAGGGAFALGDGFQPFDQNHVLVEGLAGEAWVARGAEVLRIELAGVLDLAGEEAAAQRRVGDEADAEFAHGGENLVFDVALPEGVLGLQRGDGVDLMGAADG